jgi:hypothetical protein
VLMKGSMLSKVVVLLTMSLAASMAAQSPRQFRARLSPVPLDIAMQATIAGSGSVTATLAGTTLTVSGTFKDLKSAATVARLHRSQNRGMRGPVVAELSTTTGESGEISGKVELTAAQVADATNGLLYVQLHSVKAPEGNLWGWLLSQEGKK